MEGETLRRKALREQKKKKKRVKEVGRKPELFPLGLQGREANVQSVVQLINLWQGGFLHSVQWIAALIYMVIFFKTLSTYRNLLFLSVLSLNPSCSHDTCTWTCRVNWSLSWHRWILLPHICKCEIFMINYCHNVCSSSLDLNECSTNVLFYHLWFCSPRYCINQFEPVSIVSMHQTTEKEDEEEETSFINDKKDSSPLFTQHPAHANIEGETEKSCE